MAQQCSIIGLILLLFNHLRMALIYGHNYLCRVFVELSLSSVNVMGLILKAAYPIISTKAPPPVISTKRSARRNLFSTATAAASEICSSWTAFARLRLV